ncbi:MAG: M15 family metallopeptidase [Lachnospiraceae bacterium]|nr:M15 family metallopeptidase [Lachnospiraceae bacterium]
MLLTGCGNSATSHSLTAVTEETQNVEEPLTEDQQSTSDTAEENNIQYAQTSEEAIIQITEDLPDQTVAETSASAQEPDAWEFVKVTDYIPDIVIDLKYASKDNFTGQVIYSFTDAYLRYGTVKRLQKAQSILKEEGMNLKIWDGFRPISAQFTLWEVCPDPVYVANPNSGYSAHSRGNTVDVTLVTVDKTEAEMPSDFDDFSERASRNYSDCSEEAKKNAELLENVMVECGFTPYSGEWWHYSDVDEYPVEEVFEP